MRRLLAWVVAVPLAVIGTLAGHSIGYRAAVPDAHERAHVLASSGHGYLQYVPLVVALCIAIAVLGVVATVLAFLRDRDTTRGTHQIALVALLAPVAFVAQEVVERYAANGHVHWGLLISAPFLLGLAAQLPFGLLAASIAFALGERCAPRRTGDQGRSPATSAARRDPTSLLARGRCSARPGPRARLCRPRSAAARLAE